MVKHNRRKQQINKRPLEKQPHREIKEETKTDVVYTKQKVKKPKRGHSEPPQGKEATENLDQRDHQDIKYHGIDLMMLVSELIRITLPCYVYPLIPHFYIGNWGMQGYT